MIESLTHLEELDSLYLVIGEITEAELEVLSGFAKLKRLTLGMSRAYRLKNELWVPVGKLTTLEKFDLLCDP